MYKCLFTGDGHEITDPNWVILQERPSFFPTESLDLLTHITGIVLVTTEQKRVFILLELLPTIIPDNIT